MVPIGILLVGSNVIVDNVTVDCKLQVLPLPKTSPAAVLLQAVQLLPSETNFKV
jgi:hypothetical protein